MTRNRVRLLAVLALGAFLAGGLQAQPLTPAAPSDVLLQLVERVLLQGVRALLPEEPPTSVQPPRNARKCSGGGDPNGKPPCG
jgi:hypothetical protein